MERTSSVCGACARGCNIEVETLDGFVKRLMPRENREVNDWWICDHGRHDYRYVHDDARVTVPRVGGAQAEASEAYAELVDLLGSARDAGAAPSFVIDPFLTCEEMYLIKALAGSFDGARVAGWMPPAGVEEKFPGGFVISAEKAPNRTGAEAVFGNEVFGVDADALLKDLDGGEGSLVVVFAGFPHADPPEQWAEAIAGVSGARAVFALFDGPWSHDARCVIPSASPFEKEGTYVNEDGRLQRVRSRHKPGQGMDSELQVLQEIQLRLGNRDRLLSAAGVFREMGDRIAAFSGLTHQGIPATGQPLPGFARAGAPAERGSR